MAYVKGGPPPPEPLLCQIHDGLPVVQRADGRLRTVVPTPELQQEICKYFHDESGHQGVHQTLNAVA